MNLFDFVEYAAKSVKDAYKSMEIASEEALEKFKVLNNMEEPHEASNNM